MTFLDPDIQSKVFIILLVIYGTSLHEMGHAFVATWLGDPTPGRYGRLTFNPIPHLQPVFTAVVLPALMYLTNGSLLGLAFTPINPSRFKKPLRDRALVAIAGPLMNFALAGIMIGILWIPGVFLYDPNDESFNLRTQILFWAGLWNIILGIFNLLPLPPLDGYWIIRSILPLKIRQQTDSLASMGSMTLMIPLIVGSLIFKYIQDPIFTFYVGLLPFGR